MKAGTLPLANDRENRLSPTLLLGFLAALCTTATAWGQGTRVAVIDIAKIFQHHPRLAQMREDLRREGEDFDAYLRREKQRFAQMENELRSLKPGTPDFRNLEKQLAEGRAQLEVQARLKSKELQEKAARADYAVYMEIVRHVDQFCRQQGIHMVLSYSSRPPDPNHPRSISLALNRRVVYQAGLDITDQILAAIGRTAPTHRPTTPQPTLPPR